MHGPAGVVLCLAAYASPPIGERMAEAARSLLGVPYRFGGRMKRAGDGIDCQGVLFFAAERVGRCGWRSYSVFPTRSVAERELGAPLAGASPVATASLAIDRLKIGDVLLLVGFDENPAEPPIGELAGRPVWVWHTGLYGGAGRWIVGDHFAGRVVEVPLLAYLEEHRSSYAGVFVTRLEGPPAPKRCRRVNSAR